MSGLVRNKPGNWKRNLQLRSNKEDGLLSLRAGEVTTTMIRSFYFKERHSLAVTMEAVREGNSRFILHLHPDM